MVESIYSNDEHYKEMFKAIGLRRMFKASILRLIF